MTATEPKPEQAAKPKKVTAADVREALRSRWPSDQHVFIDEAPDSPTRMGRKLDVLVVSTWRSRGFELDGVEVKVSLSDLKREIDQPEKADWWWGHVHRFWLAVPVAMAAKARNEVPTGWGLLAVDAGRSQVVIKPARHDPEPFTWPEMVGLLRAACNAGPGALDRQYRLGLEAGKVIGKSSVAFEAANPQLEREVADLIKLIDTFKEQSGIDLRDREQVWGLPDVARIGRLVAMGRRQLSDPARYQSELLSWAMHIEGQATGIRDLAAKLAELSGPADPTDAS